MYWLKHTRMPAVAVVMYAVLPACKHTVDMEGLPYHSGCHAFRSTQAADFVCPLKDVECFSRSVNLHNATQSHHSYSKCSVVCHTAESSSALGWKHMQGRLLCNVIMHMQDSSLHSKVRSCLLAESTCKAGYHCCMITSCANAFSQKPPHDFATPNEGGTLCAIAQHRQAHLCIRQPLHVCIYLADDILVAVLMADTDFAFKMHIV